METNTIKKTNWKLLIFVILITAIQALLIYYGFILIVFNGLDTYLPDILFKGIIILIVALILPLLFLPFAKRTKSIPLLGFNLFISICIIIFLIITFVSLGGREVNQKTQEIEFDKQTTEETNIARPLYLEAVKELKQPQSIIDIILVPNTYSYYLLTDKNSRLTSETLNGISLASLKTLIGKKIDVHIDNFISAQYPVYKYIDKWYYDVTIYCNGKLIDKTFFSAQ